MGGDGGAKKKREDDETRAGINNFISEFWGLPWADAAPALLLLLLQITASGNQQNDDK